MHSRALRVSVTLSLRFISSIQVAFKSEYLQLFQAQQVTASELLVAKEALAEAKLVRDLVIRKLTPSSLPCHSSCIVVEPLSSKFLSQDSYNTEKALAWLTAAHAEERALRVGIKSQMVEMQVS